MLPFNFSSSATQAPSGRARHNIIQNHSFRETFIAVCRNFGAEPSLLLFFSLASSRCQWRVPAAEAPARRQARRIGQHAPGAPRKCLWRGGPGVAGARRCRVAVLRRVRPPSARPRRAGAAEAPARRQARRSGRHGPGAPRKCLWRGGPGGAGARRCRVAVLPAGKGFSANPCVSRACVRCVVFLSGPWPRKNDRATLPTSKRFAGTSAGRAP